MKNSLGVAAGSLAIAQSKKTLASSHNSRPNVVIITCHDIGQHLHCYGVDAVSSPNLDHLAEQGIRFSNLFSTSAVCSPGRGSLHTGRYPQSNGLMGLTHSPWWWRLNDDERHTAQILRDAGYDTHLIGLNHIHPDHKRLGYNHRHSPKNDAHETVRASKELFEKTKNQDSPFFAKIGFFEVHRPFVNGKWTENGVFVPLYLQETETIKSDLADLQGTIRFFDQRVGEILDALDASGQADNTLVIYTAEHGIPYPGAKWSARKNGLEIPLMIRWPGTALEGGKVYDDLMSIVDILPTLLNYLEIDIPENIQGVSFKDRIEGKTNEPLRQYAYGQYTPDMKRDNLSRCIVTNQYHLIRYFDQGRTVDYPVDVDPVKFAAHQERCKTRGTRPFYQLYDIQKDPYELNDLGQKEEYSKIAEELSDQLLAWMREVNDPLLQGPLRTPYYERAMKDFLG